TDLHSKFNVLIAKYLHLTNLVNDPHSTLLQSYTVFPHEAPANDQHVQNLSVLLRTKLFPELEQDTEDRIKDGSVPGLQSSGNTAEDRKILQALKLKVMMHDALCQAADEIFENHRDTVNPKARYESDAEDEGDSEAIEGTSATESTIDRISNSAQQATTTNGRNKQQPVGVPPVIDFAVGMQDPSASIRYMDDWNGTLNDLDGYSSGYDGNEMDGADDVEFDDSYFERRRQEGIVDDVNLSEEEEEAAHEADESEDEDTFMEVSTGHQATYTDANSSIAHLIPDGEDSAEEDMEEIM
ncbi:hypothetical protein BGZ99_007792, partial [Dissophora globulifera]